MALKLSRRAIMAAVPLAFASKSVAASQAREAVDRQGTNGYPSLLPHLSLELWWRPA